MPVKKGRSLHPKGLNEFFHLEGGVTEIVITRGLKTIIDTSDFESIRNYRWSAKPIRKGWYAATGRGPDNKPAYLHCAIMGKLEDGLEVDHRSGDGLDNRRSNFRLLTHSQNCFNVGGRPDRGITFSTDGRRRPWCSRTTREGKTTSRYFFTKEEAITDRALMESLIYPEVTRDGRRTWSE